MIVLDTNVVSEAKRPRPAAGVRDWIERQRTSDLFLTTTVICELAEGIHRLPQGRRRQDLDLWLAGLVNADFRGRILELDVQAAQMFGMLAAAAWAQGRPPGMANAQIAAIAAVHGMSVATRDIADFAAFGIPLVNPWTDA